MPATSHHMRGARNPIVLSAHSGGPFSRITAAGAPLKNAPRRFFRTGSRPSATTVSSQDTQLRSPTVVAITSATVALKYSSSSVAYSLRIAPAPIWRFVPPATRSLGCSCSGEFQAIARLNLWGPCGRSSGDSVYWMTALQEIRICRRPCRLPNIKLEAQRRCRFTLPTNPTTTTYWGRTMRPFMTIKVRYVLIRFVPITARGGVPVRLSTEGSAGFACLPTKLQEACEILGGRHRLTTLSIRAFIHPCVNTIHDGQFCVGRRSRWHVAPECLVLYGN